MCVLLQEVIENQYATMVLSTPAAAGPSPSPLPPSSFYTASPMHVSPLYPPGTQQYLAIVEPCPPASSSTALVPSSIYFSPTPIFLPLSSSLLSSSSIAAPATFWCSSGYVYVYFCFVVYLLRCHSSSRCSGGSYFIIFVFFTTTFPWLWLRLRVYQRACPPFLLLWLLWLLLFLPSSCLSAACSTAIPASLSTLPTTPASATFLSSAAPPASSIPDSAPPAATHPLPPLPLRHCLLQRSLLLQQQQVFLAAFG